MIHCLTVENVIIGKACLFQSFIFSFYWPFIYLLLPICLTSSLTAMCSPLCTSLCVTHLFYVRMMWRTVPSLLLSHFRSLASHFSSLISLPSFFFCPRLALSTPLAVVSILSLSLNTVHPSVYISYYPPFPASCSLILLPSPPALVDWAWDLCHDLCGGGARLRAHWDHKQLPHSDKVMDH